MKTLNCVHTAAAVKNVARRPYTKRAGVKKPFCSKISPFFSKFGHLVQNLAIFSKSGNFFSKFGILSPTISQLGSSLPFYTSRYPE